MTSATSRRSPKQRARSSVRTLTSRPLVVDTRELGRRPGQQRELEDEVPAPAGLGIDVISVPEGAPLQLQLRLEAVMEGVLVSGTVISPVEGECSRCLEPVRRTLETDVQVLYSYDPLRPDEQGDGDLAELDGDLLDLEPAVRDAVVLALPLAPLCREDCEGLCDQCGERMADLPDDHEHVALDPRWAGLAALQTDTPNPNLQED